MPRKTFTASFGLDPDQGASMRPRPDAAENAVPSVQRTLRFTGLQ